MIQEIRLRYALSALKYSDDTVAEIGYKHGFSSPTYFSRAFRKRFGLSPTSYTHHLTPHH
jgi:AraC-like DNA-binding protein